MKVLPRVLIDVLRIVDDENGRLRLIVKDFVVRIRRIEKQFSNDFFQHLSLQDIRRFVDVHVQLIEVRSQEKQILLVI